MKEPAREPDARGGGTARAERTTGDRSPPSKLALPPSLATREPSREAEADRLGRQAIGDRGLLASVRIHDDAASHAAAAGRGARAYALGSDIYFGRGQLTEPRLAHELGHVVQQQRESLSRIDRDDDLMSHDTPLTWDSARALTYAAMSKSVISNPTWWERLVADQIVGDQMLKIDPVVPEVDQPTVATAFEDAIRTLMPQPTADIELAGDDSKVTVDIQWALDILTEQLGSPELGDFGLPTAFGTDLFAHHMADHVGTVVEDMAKLVRTTYNGWTSSAPMSLADTLAEAVTLALPGFKTSLTETLTSAVTTWGDPYGILELELEASMHHLARLRDEFKNATDEKVRANLGAKLGYVARRMVVLDRHLVPVEQRVTARESGELVANIGDTSNNSTVSAVLDAVRAGSKTEADTLGPGGGELSELGTHGAALDSTLLPYFVKPTMSISPEEAYPRYSDAATLAGQKSLADHFEQESADLAKQKAELVPTAITSIEQFEEVYRDWLTFWSRTSRDQSPEYQMITQLYSPILDILGYGGASGWLGTMMLTSMFGQIVPTGHADSDSLVQEVDARIKLTPFDITGGKVMGTGGSSGVTFKTATLAPSSGTNAVSMEGERRGRETTVQQTTGASQKVFQEVYQAKPDERVGVAAQRGRYRGKPGSTMFWPQDDPTNVKGFTSNWSYLLATQVLNMGTLDFDTHFEHKQARTRIANYLLAYAQAYKSADREHFLKDDAQRTVGEDRIRGKGGLESGTASAGARYLEGKADDITDRQSDGYVRRIKNARDAIGKHTAPMLVRDLEKALDGFFSSAGEIDRVRAIIIIATEQNDLEKSILEKFSFDAIKRSIVFVAGVAGVLWGLSRLGWIGEVAALSLRTALGKLGLRTDINTVVLVGTWATESATTTGFHDAQRWAFIGSNAAGALAELLRDEAFSKALKATGSAAKWAFAKVTKPKGISADSFKDMFGPDGIGKQASWELETDLRTKLDGGGKLDKDAIDFLKNASPELHNRLKNDYPDAFRASAATIDLKPGTAPHEMKSMVEKELPADLAGQVTVVQVDGAGVRVRVSGGKLVVEVGKSMRTDAAGKAIMSPHIGTLRRYAPFTGQLGRVRYFAAKIGAYIGLKTAASVSGEAADELTKLNEVKANLEALRTRTEKNLDTWTEHPNRAAQADLDLELKYIKEQIATYETKLGETGIGKRWIAAESTNFGAVDGLKNGQGKPVLGEKLDDVGRQALKDLGYRIDKNDVIYRPDASNNSMVPLTTKNGVVQVSAYESPAAVQARIYDTMLTPAQRAAVDARRLMAPTGTKVLLVEGVHDTGATWKQILGGPANAAKRAELNQILTKHGGIKPADAEKLITDLVNRPGTIKVVFGTDPVRGAFDYRGDTPVDTVAHHFDPLYLGGGHGMIAKLPTKSALDPLKNPHDMVHRFFDQLETPDLPTVSPRKTPLQPTRLQGAVAGTPSPSMVYVRGDEVSYNPFDP